MVEEIGDPTEDTGKGARGGSVPGTTWRDRTKVAAQDAVAEEAVTLVEYRTGIIENVESWW